MQLPEFIKRALAFFEGTEAKLQKLDLAQAELTKAQARILELEGAVADLQVKLQAAEEAGKGHEVKITNLTAEVAKEQNRANATIAAQGIPADQTPAAEPGGAAVVRVNAWQKYRELLASDPRMAGAYYAEHADEIIQERIAKG